MAAQRIVCIRSSHFRAKKINSICGVNDIEIPAETDRLEFDVNGEHADTILMSKFLLRKVTED